MSNGVLDCEDGYESTFSAVRALLIDVLYFSATMAYIMVPIEIYFYRSRMMMEICSLLTMERQPGLAITILVVRNKRRFTLVTDTSGRTS
jgi:hypothetical protein